MKSCFPCILEGCTMSLPVRFQGLERLGELALVAGTRVSPREP